ncbi:hypothetical protein M758_12G127700 [Ceratodon purpureus]|nr:hypothetical protein M758_12G127700 [Ceratodon purpureus]
MAREESLRMGALVIAVFASALQTCRSKKNIAKLEESAMFKLEVLAFRKSGILWDVLRQVKQHFEIVDESSDFCCALSAKAINCFERDCMIFFVTTLGQCL